MNELVEFLSNGEHPVIVARSESAQEFKEAVDREHILVKFTDTKGGTELGFALDPDETALEEGDFEKAEGKIKLVGDLTLNYDRVQCIAEIDLSTLEGFGYLRYLEKT